MDLENRDNEIFMSYCPSCNEEVDMTYWVNDQYGIPYKAVCENCYEKTKAELRDDYAELGIDDPFESLPDGWD